MVKRFISLLMILCVFLCSGVLVFADSDNHFGGFAGQDDAPPPVPVDGADLLSPVSDDGISPQLSMTPYSSFAIDWYSSSSVKAGTRNAGYLQNDTGQLSMPNGFVKSTTLYDFYNTSGSGMYSGTSFPLYAGLYVTSYTYGSGVTYTFDFDVLPAIGVYGGSFSNVTYDNAALIDMPIYYITFSGICTIDRNGNISTAGSLPNSYFHLKQYYFSRNGHVQVSFSCDSSFTFSSVIFSFQSNVKYSSNAYRTYSTGVSRFYSGAAGSSVRLYTPTPTPTPLPPSQDSTIISGAISDQTTAINTQIKNTGSSIANQIQAGTTAIQGSISSQTSSINSAIANAHKAITDGLAKESEAIQSTVKDAFSEQTQHFDDAYQSAVDDKQTELNGQISGGVADMDAFEQSIHANINDYKSQLDFGFGDLGEAAGGLNYIKNIFMMIWDNSPVQPIVLSLMLGLALLLLGRGARAAVASDTKRDASMSDYKRQFGGRG